MPHAPIDFNGIIDLNQATLGLLQGYLENKESQLGKVIIDSIHPYQSPSVPPAITLPPQAQIKLSEAVETLGKQIRQLQQIQTPLADSKDWKRAVEKINKGLWEYLEVLEECITELFQQLNLISIEEWKKELVDIVSGIKETLVHRLDDLQWKAKRIESQLREYRRICENHFKGNFWKKIASYFFSLLDRSLFSNLSKSRKYLEFQYQNFSSRFKHFDEIHHKINHSLGKFNHYIVFPQMEDDFQKILKKLYQLIKLWELNLKIRFLPRNEVIRSLRSFVGPEKAFSVFKEYFRILKKELFIFGNLIKSNQEILSTNEKVEKIDGELLICRGELHTLGVTVAKYRDFLLRTDPNPYVRSRLGFPEWIAGPEPHLTKGMLALAYDIENLDSLYEKFRQAIERKSVAPDAPISESDDDIQKILHEVAQPLMSKSLMRLHVDRLINLLQQFDELSNTDPGIVNYIGRTLCKVLRADWKYNVLFGIPAFHDLYAIHHGLIGPIDDRGHLNRMQKFKRFIQQIEQWIESKSTPRHTHEIELDINDMKGYLQDFLGQVQRFAAQYQKESGEKGINLIENELLEYRYLFGNFFHHLREEKPDERMIRRQFLFVDQYFEAVENKLNDLRQGYKQDENRMETS